ncbi:MAG: SpoIIE family protein phosphatase [Phycisphaerales bacterium]|nr:SpoIIE family protein phosphatase [Planctomycetota bacterium]MCH8508502.1 SpoIIE family protein phosphatase [Phycisphaerales bacterium]
MMPRLSVRVLVPVMVVVPVAGVAAALGWIGVRSSRDSVEDLASRIVGQIGARAGRQVETHLGVAGTASDAAMVLVEDGVLDIGDLRSWAGMLPRLWRAFDGLSGIAFGRTDGGVVWIAQYPGDAAPEFAIKDDATGELVEQFDLDEYGQLGTEPDRRVAYDLFSRPWYIAGAEGAIGNFPGSRYEPSWSPIYSWSRPDGTGDTLGVSYARPVYGAGKAFVGVLDTEIELVGLSSFLSTLRIGETGLAVIVERDGGMVAASRPQGLLGSDGARRAVWAAEDERTRALGAAVQRRIGSGNGAGLARSDVRGEAWWVQVSPVRVGIGGGLDWVLIVAVPESDLTGGVRATQRRALHAGMAASGLAVLIGMLGAVWLTRPILKLRRHAHAVGEGDLDTPLSLGGASEYAELGRAINAMQAGLKDRMRLRQSLELAMDVQQALLPDGPPRVEGLDVAGHSTYCDETGGDYYDYLEVTEIAPGGLAVVLGDVMGHGIAAALLMATARGVIRSRADEAGSLAELLDHTNAQLVRDTGGRRFMTMLLVLLDPRRGVLRWASAGQGPPMLYDPGTGSWVGFGQGGMPLGLVEEERYEEHAEPVLRPGCVVLLGTDGLWEAHNEVGEQFEIERVRAVIEANASESAEAISSALRSALDAHCGARRPEDDVTFVVVKVSG